MEQSSNPYDLLMEMLDQAVQQGDESTDSIINLLKRERKRVANLKKNINYQSDSLDALLNAIDKADIDCVRQIVNYQIALEEDIGEEATILMYASGSGSFEIVKFLVELGANVNARSGADFPLSNAAIEGHQEIYDYLAPLTEPRLRSIAEEILASRIASKDG